MPQYIRNSDGTKTIVGKFGLGGLPTVKDILPDGCKGVSKYIKAKKGVKVKKTIAKHYKRSNNSELARSVVKFALEKILERVAIGDIFLVENNSNSHILLEPFPNEEVKNLRKAGAYKNVDMMKTNYRIPRFVLYLNDREFNLRYRRIIRVPKELAAKAIKALEDGLVRFDKLI